MFKHKFILGLLATLALAAPLAVTEAPAQAATAHRIVFRAWGTPPRALVDVAGKTDIEMRRNLPYKNVQYLSGWDRSFASISVEDSRDRRVGCSITDNGVLVARDVSNYGFAYCYHP